MSVPWSEVNKVALLVNELGAGWVLHTNPVWVATVEEIIEELVLLLVIDLNKSPVFTAGFTSRLSFIGADE